MERTERLGRVREVRLGAGTIRYREAGSGPPIVFVHGLLTNGNLWRNVAPPLAGRFRCIAPDWPLGAHRLPMRADADLSVAGQARLIAEFLAALDLRDVTLVANDTGGALCQFVVADHPDRVERLVLTDCDAFENFLPLPVRYFQWGSHVPGFLWLVAKALRVRPLHRLPITFGWLTKRPIERRVLDSYLAPVMTDAAIRRDLGKTLRDISPRRTLDVATRLPAFTKPVLLAWAPEDKLFGRRYAERLGGLFRDARLREVPDSYAFVPEDQPERLAALIAEFLREAAGASAPASALAVVS